MMTCASAGRASDAPAAYLRDVSRYSILTTEEERHFARRVQGTGDTRAAHRLVTANLRFVVRVACEFRGYGVRMADLIQEGNIGLMRAVQRFDPDRNVRLVTYAESWIRSCIRNYIVRNWSLVKVGTTQAQRRLFFGLPRALREVERERAVTGMTDASDVERVAARLSVKASEVSEMRLRLQRRDLSLDAPATDERRDARIDSLASAVPSQDDALGSAEESRRLAGHIGEALARLDPRERLVLELRLLGDPPIAMTEIGRRLGVSRERARQLEVRARRKLQAELGGLGPGGALSLSSPLAPAEVLQRRPGRRAPIAAASHREGSV